MLRSRGARGRGVTMLRSTLITLGSDLLEMAPPILEDSRRARGRNNASV